jgi:hypothetical protein
MFYNCYLLHLYIHIADYNFQPVIHCVCRRKICNILLAKFIKSMSDIKRALIL